MSALNRVITGFAFLSLALSAIPSLAQREGREDLYRQARSYTPKPSPDHPIQRLGRFAMVGGKPDFIQLQGALSPLPPRVYVLVHGWAPGCAKAVHAALSRGELPLAWNLVCGDTKFNDGWFQNLSKSILDADPQATVLFFSWIDWSGTEGLHDPSGSQAHTHDAGTVLALALGTALPGLDGRKIQFIGHSHGAKVATVAALVIKPAGLTLLDSPETGQLACRFGAANKLYHDPYLPALRPGRFRNSTFVDAYYSYFGMCFHDLRAELAPIVDFKLDPRECSFLGIACRHSSPMRFLPLANRNPAKGLGVFWSPLQGSRYTSLQSSYRQSWEGDDPLAHAASTQCFDSYRPCGKSNAVAKALGALRSRALEFVQLVKAGHVEIQGKPNQLLTLQESSSAFWVVSFEKRSGDETILFDYRFPAAGDGDELGVWIDDIQELAITGIWSRETWRSTLVSIEQLEDGPHTLTIALHGIGQPNSSLQVKNLQVAGFAEEETGENSPSPAK